MFDAKSLLDRFLGSQTGADLQNKLGGMLQQGQTQGGDLMTQAKDMLGQGMQAIQSGQGIDGVVQQGKAFLDQNKTGLLTGLAAGALGALVLGTRSGRAVGSTAVKLGGLALVGGLAYKAYQNWQNGQAGSAPPAGAAGLSAPPATSELAPPDADSQNALALLALKTMVAAAACDGVIDEDERSRILGRMSQLGYDPEANSWLDSEMANPATAADLAAETAGSMEKAAGVYAAACLALTIDTAEERTWLNSLADALAVDANLQIQIETEVSALRAEDPTS
jgi:uncharacterized membrane protein YebE (DUF533 family)